MMEKYDEGMVMQVYIIFCYWNLVFFTNNVIAIIHCQHAWT